MGSSHEDWRNIPRAQAPNGVRRLFLFLFTIALSGAAGPLAPIAIGSALMVMVHMGGQVSAGHGDPAVSLGAFLRGAIDALTMVTYGVVKLVAGVLAFVVGYLVSGTTIGIHPGPHIYAGGEGGRRNESSRLIISSGRSHL